MDQEYPLVTVIAACYNHERFVVECLEGIRNQTYPNIQLIITDDCSKDRSVDVIENWIESHKITCDFIRHDLNKGLPKTLNEALAIAEGKFISIIATDDVWLPEFISTYVQEMEKRSPEFGLIYGNSFMIDEDGNRLPTLRKHKDLHPEGNVLFDLIKETFIATNTVIMKKTFLDEVGGYDESLFFEDFDMWTRLARICSFAYCSEILAMYRVVNSSMVHVNKNEVQGSYLKILSRLEEECPTIHNEIENRKIGIAEDLYRLNFQNNFRYLVKKFYISKSKKYLFLMVMSFLGFKYEIALKIWTFVNTMRISKKKVSIN